MSRAGKWAKVSSAGEPERWSRPCGLVQLYVQDHPHETVRSMRVKWQVLINDKVFQEGHKSNIRMAKAKATFAAHVALVGALEHVVGLDITKWHVS